ncbi:MAG: glutamate-5-semialdehyde dehydrogenase [Fusobacteriaceae bacterium]
MLNKIGNAAKDASKIVARLSTDEKNKILLECAEELEKNSEFILAENKKDILEAIKNNMHEQLVDRLKLDSKRIYQMSKELKQVASLDDPIGEIISSKNLPNGLKILKKRIPIGVIGVIYESRPNVTSDVFGLCFKAGSALILKGGKEALNSNVSIIKIIAHVLEKNNLPKNIVQIIEDTSRETTLNFMKLNKFVDVLIPRGGAGLINSVIENSTIPVIETGVGNVHIYVDEFADTKKALEIILNAKVQRPSVCNSCEKLLIHEKLLTSFLKEICEALKNNHVEIRGDKIVCENIYYSKIATEEDWHKEYLDFIIAIKIVSNIDEAIIHIEKYSTHHSDAIITENKINSEKFLNEIDSAAVYVNASTRFTDGAEFGLGSEIGISTQKLHARGPMGLSEITSYKYLVLGDGQVRK